MNTQLLIVGAIGICSLILIYVLFKKQVNYLIYNMTIGLLIIYCVNALVPSIAIGLNGLTLVTSSLLGIPGVAAIYLVSYIL